MSKYAVLGNRQPDASFKPRVARAYCEGRQANSDGILIDGNPFSEAQESGNWLAWQWGHNDFRDGIPARETHCAPEST